MNTSKAERSESSPPIRSGPTHHPRPSSCTPLATTPSNSLEKTLTDRGLAPGADDHQPARSPLPRLHLLLQDRYYVGYVNFKGREYEGRHQPLVSPEIFGEVQAIMTARSTQGNRQRVYHHYLKGHLFCGSCHDLGKQSRMIMQRSLGRGGEYFYFFCRGLQRHDCDTRYIDVGVMEELVEQEYHRLELDLDFSRFLRDELDEAQSDQQKVVRLRRDQLVIELERLDRQESNLVDLLADDQLDSDIARKKMRQIRDQRIRFQSELTAAGDGLAAGADLIEYALKLARESP